MIKFEWTYNIENNIDFQSLLESISEPSKFNHIEKPSAEEYDFQKQMRKEKEEKIVRLAQFRKSPNYIGDVSYDNEEIARLIYSDDKTNLVIKLKVPKTETLRLEELSRCNGDNLDYYDTMIEENLPHYAWLECFKAKNVNDCNKLKEISSTYKEQNTNGLGNCITVFTFESTEQIMRDYAAEKIKEMSLNKHAKKHSDIER